AVDLRMLLHAVRLHKAIFAVVVALGIAGGVAYTLVKPPLLASTQLVIVAGAKSVKTQAFYASSDPVLTMARKRLAQPISLDTLLCAITSGARGRQDRKLRERDEIAGAIGVPVLASIPVVHPSDTAGWTRLLQEYQPAVVHAWNLRKALRYIGVSDVRYNGG